MDDLTTVAALMAIFVYLVLPTVLFIWAVHRFTRRWANANKALPNRYRCAAVGHASECVELWYHSNHSYRTEAVQK